MEGVSLQGAGEMKVFGMSLWTHSEEAADAVVEFVVNRATANGECLVQCLDMLVRNFLPPSCGLPVFIDSFSRRSLMKGLSKDSLMGQKAEHMAKKDVVLQRIHFAIRHIAELVPMTTLHLQRIVLQRMPHRIVDKEWNALYLENMLRLENCFAGEFIGTQMLMAIVDRLVEIDVEIRWEDVVRDDSSKLFIFNMDLDDGFENTDIGAVSLNSNGLENKLKPQPELESKRQSLGAVADKMDVLMTMTFEHLQNCAANGRTSQVFRTLMNSFQSTILDTYKSKFTQFLIFYLCSLAPTTCGADFASLLFDIITCKEQAPSTRISAAAYLASFLARAKFLPLFVVSSFLKRLVEWCVSYMPHLNDKKSSAIVDAGTNGIFFAACQAVLYVLCFRMKRLLEEPEQQYLLWNLPVKQLLNHNLDPLKLCLPSVVEEFVKQAQRVGLVDTLSSVEVNGKAESQLSGTFGGFNQLDMFFPFDPYLLRESDRFIRPIYIFWSMVQPGLPEEEAIQEVEASEVENGDHIVEEPFTGSIVEDAVERKTLYQQTRANGINNKKHEPGCVDTAIHNNIVRDGSMHEEEYSDDIDSFESALNHMSITPVDTVLVMPANLTKLPAKIFPSTTTLHSIPRSFYSSNTLLQ
eukprot:c25688_g1_i1 orf=353-2260(-)